MSHSLATSSLLTAVGVHPGAAVAVGATAAVKWIAKDGIGAFGRLLVRLMHAEASKFAIKLLFGKLCTFLSRAPRSGYGGIGRAECWGFSVRTVRIFLALELCI